MRAARNSLEPLSMTRTEGSSSAGPTDAAAGPFGLEGDRSRSTGEEEEEEAKAEEEGEPEEVE